MCSIIMIVQTLWIKLMPDSELWLSQKATLPDEEIAKTKGSDIPMFHGCSIDQISSIKDLQNNSITVILY